MSTQVRKVRITTTDTGQITSKIKIMKRLATYMATLPGCSISTPLTEDRNRFFVNLNISGNGKDEFALASLGSLNSPTTYWGLCDHGYDPDLSDAGNGKMHFPYYFYWMHENVYDYHDFVFIIKDGKLICHSDAVGGYLIFKHESGIKSFFQTQIFMPNWYINGNDNSISLLTNTTAFGEDIIVKQDQAGVCTILGGCNTCLYISASTYHVPSNKLLKFSKVVQDKIEGVEGNVEDYPINMSGDLILPNYQPYYGNGIMCATHKKVMVDGQKYIHIGGSAWMPYDTISEETISAD